MSYLRKFWFIPVLILAILLPSAFKTEYIAQVAIMALLYASFASAWNIIAGYCGQTALGNGVYIGIGAYITAILFRDYMLSPWIGMLVGGLVSGLISVIISYPVFRLKGTYFAISTTALLHVIRMVVQQERYIFGIDFGGTVGVKIKWFGGLVAMQFVEKRAYYYIALGLLVVILLISSHIKNSKTGYYFMAINSNQNSAASLGVNVRGYKLLAQFLCTFFMGVGGGVYAMLNMFVDPTRVLGYNLSLEVIIFTIVGGRGTLWGPVLGALVLYPINEAIRANFATKLPGISTMIYGVILMLVV